MPDQGVVARVEDRVGVDRLEELHAKRRELIAQAAPLRARYDDRVFDMWRKTQLASIAMKIRGLAVEEGKKVTEASIEESAHADPKYVDIITQAIADRAKLQELENQITEIQERIVRDTALIGYARTELGIT